MTNPVDVEIPYHLQQSVLAESSLSGLSDVFLGWVKNSEFTTPSLSIVTGDVQRTDANGIECTKDVDPDTVAVFYRDSKVVLPLTLELYATSKTERMNFAEPVRKLFHPDPSGSQAREPDRYLTRTLDGHHDAEAHLRLRDSTPSDGEGVREGYFRRTYEVMAETVELTRHEYEKATFSANLET